MVELLNMHPFWANSSKNAYFSYHTALQAQPQEQATCAHCHRLVRTITHAEDVLGAKNFILSPFMLT